MRLAVAMLLGMSVGLGAIAPARAADLPAEGSVIVARVRGDAVVVWDATDELLGLMAKKENKSQILLALESEAARLLTNRAVVFKDRATSLTVNVTYKHIGAVSPVYKAATLEGVEQLLRLRALMGPAASATTWPEDVAAGKPPKDLTIVVVGSLPPDLK